ncbi:MAG: hypothetical protein KAX09_11200, partial [Candidatus Heimdallarchaeota archaeon]|nr:hypothetical protein [Candidatus Heimdallarchaeota archaeon]MCK4291539.1 hypothetical protein [Candidatus Heimdallarchaeota archaeon]
MGFSIKKALILIVIFLIVLNPTSTYSMKSANTSEKISTNLIQINHIKRSPNFIKTANVVTEDEEIGNQEVFWSLDVAAGLYVQKLATLLSVGEKCYVYVANETITLLGESVAISRCNFYRDEFDAVIYDKNIEFMGHPDGRFGDIDGDPKVTIFIANLNGAGGLYLQKDELANSTYSNLREMIYIDYRLGTREGALMTIMHEFNHLIWFNNEMDEGHFLLEGAAEFSIFYAGYTSDWGNITGHTNLFSENHQRSLLSFHLNNHAPLPEDYGQSYLFILYLVEQYGIDFLSNLVMAQLDGPLGVDYALNETGSTAKFNDVFLDWITACTIDSEDPSLSNYSFTNVGFTVVPDDEIQNYPYQKNDVLHYPYGFHVKKLNHPPDKFTFSITNPNPTFSMGISIAIHDQNGWHVMQSLYSETSELISINVSGEEI